MRSVVALGVLAFAGCPGQTLPGTPDQVCNSDLDCESGRVCVGGSCVIDEGEPEPVPSPAPSPAPEPAPAPTPSPEPAPVDGGPIDSGRDAGPGDLDAGPADAGVDAGFDASAPVDAGACGPFDEDGDGIFDLCDNCPAIPNPGQLDEGEEQAGGAPDGVGDICDPWPDLSGTTMFFSGFHDGEGFTPQTGTWVFANGTVQRTDLTEAVRAILLVDAPAQFERAAVDVVFSIDETAISNFNVGIVFGFDPNAGSGGYCAYNDDDEDPVDHAVGLTPINNFGAGSFGPVEEFPALDFGARRGLRAFVDDNRITCTIDTGRSVNASFDFPVGQAALRMWSATGAFESFTLYQQAP